MNATYDNVWAKYREKIALVTSLEALVVHKGFNISVYGQPFKSWQGHLTYHRYNQRSLKNRRVANERTVIRAD